LPILKVLGEWEMRWARGDIRDSDLDVELLMIIWWMSTKWHVWTPLCVTQITVYAEKVKNKSLLVCGRELNTERLKGRLG
jgi:hypothetical protein